MDRFSERARTDAGARAERRGAEIARDDHAAEFAPLPVPRGSASRVTGERYVIFAPL